MKFGRSLFLVLFSTLLGITACSPVQQPATPTSIPPTATAVPLYQQVTLTSVASETDGASPNYKITLQTPTLTGSDDPRVKAFNEQITALLQKAADDFKNNVTSNAIAIPGVSGSEFDEQYKNTAPQGNIVSIQFQMLGYVSGMAHPYHLNPTFTYDIEGGKVLALGDLFLPNSDYLTPISKYCAAELSKRDIGFTADFTQGADPKPENYQNWNITPDGLAIIFSEYQVAPYAAGPQTVTIPYGELKDLIDPNGPLASFVK